MVRAVVDHHAVWQVTVVRWQVKCVRDLSRWWIGSALPQIKHAPLTLLSLTLDFHFATDHAYIAICLLTAWRSTDSTAPPSRDRVGVVVLRTRWNHLWLRRRDCGDRSQSFSACSACDGDTRRQWLPCDGGLHVLRVLLFSTACPCLQPDRTC
jgi:hypothetical protein